MYDRSLKRDAMRAQVCVRVALSVSVCVCPCVFVEGDEI